MKSIYDEVLDILDNILIDSFSDPQDEYNDCYMLNFKQIIKIEKAIKKAQKQEKLLKSYQELYKDYEVYVKQKKLLELYKKLATVRDDMLDTREGDELYDLRDIEMYLKRLIKEMENDK